MSWASHHIEQLRQGKTVVFRPRGSSMKGKVESGQQCTVQPLSATTVLSVGTIVLCTVKGRQFLHLIKAIQGARFQIGNNRGGINGWIGIHGIHGVCVSVTD